MITIGMDIVVQTIITDRKYSSTSSVSNLLNISDGLLSDFLNVQIVCTFNMRLILWIVPC